MKLQDLKVFTICILALMINSTGVFAQTTSTDNTLGATGVTAIQSTTDANHQLSIGGAVKIFNTGNSGLSSPSLYFHNTSTSGRNYFLNSDNTGAFRILDNSITIPRFIVFNSGNIGIGTNTDDGYKLDISGAMRLSSDAFVNSLTIGKSVGSNNGTSTAIGINVLGANTSGYSNTALGYQSLFSNTEGFGNVAIGTQSMYSSTGAGGTGYQNTAVGQSTLFSNTTGTNNTAIGIQSMYHNTTGAYNTALGSTALRDNTTGIYNTGLGANAMLKNTTGAYNTAIGYTALSENLTGTSNTAIGWQALFANTGSGNTAVGRDALTYNTTGINNTAVGGGALYSSGTGYNNSAFGSIALQNSNLGIGNTASGVASLQFNTSGNYNSAFGHYAGNDLISGESNIFLGSNTGRGITTGSYNTIIGAQVTSLPSSLSNNIIIADGQGNRRINVDENGNVGIGTTTPSEKLDVVGNLKFSNALMPNNNAGIAGQVLTSNGTGIAPTWATISGSGSSNNWSLLGNAGIDPTVNFIGTTDDKDVIIKRNGIQSGLLSGGQWNTSFGIGALNPLSSHTTGGGYGMINAFGVYALHSNTTGYMNDAFGARALYANTTGEANVAMGAASMYSNISGSGNNAFGTDALRGNITGSENVAFGTSALYNNTEGRANVGMGLYALQSNTQGNYNIGIGSNAGNDLISGQNNVFLGSLSGWGITTGSNNTILGSNVSGLSSSLSNNIIIADGQGNRRINIDASGLVGIGTTTPSALLHLRSQGGSNSGILVESPNPGNYATVELRNDANDLTQIGLTGSAFNSGIFTPKSTTLNTNGAGGINLIAYNTLGVIRFATGGVETSNERMRIDAAGNISIGTIDPKGYKLAVNGSAIFTKAVVKLNGNWPDYVFKPTYKLLSLNDVEAYLQKNNHLPEIPSAAEVQKNGIDLGENQATLLKKLEELTLYMIDMNKQVEVLNKRVEVITKENEQLKKEVKANR